MRLAPALVPAVALALPLLAACGKQGAPPLPKGGPVEVAVVTVAPRDVPAVFEYVAQTQSSRQVNIQAQARAARAGRRADRRDGGSLRRRAVSGAGDRQKGTQS